MKKLISMNELQLCFAKGEKTLEIDGNTLITPAARDAAVEMGIAFTLKTDRDLIMPITLAHPSSESVQRHGDVEFITRLVLEAMRGILPTQLGFDQECDPGGLRLIRGNTLPNPSLPSGGIQGNMNQTEVIRANENGANGAGFMIFDQKSVSRKLTGDEFSIVLSGTLEIEVNGRTYKGNAGDVFFIPKGSCAVWHSPEKARIFYVRQHFIAYEG